MIASGASDQQETLEHLARHRFGDLSRAEFTLVRALPNGAPAYCGKADDRALADIENSPYASQPWGPDREIRADLIRWLAVDREAQQYVDPQGIEIASAVITGDLDLSFVSFDFPLWLANCRFPGLLRLNYSEMKRLALDGCRCGPIYAEGLRVRGDIVMNRGFSSTGPVDLMDIEIGGNLDCSHGIFEGGSMPNPEALAADRARIRGSVFLCDGFQAKREVRFAGAQIGGDLLCDDAHFSGTPEPTPRRCGRALLLAGAQVGGKVVLGNGFVSDGEVNLQSARIEGNLDCSRGTFRGGAAVRGRVEGLALNLGGAKIGSVYLHDGFYAAGEVRLLGVERSNFAGRLAECPTRDHRGYPNLPKSAKQGRSDSTDGSVCRRVG
jgi:hypothetical protein